MGLRFSRRIKILPGLSLNLSGSGVSLSAGPRGAKINFGARGVYGTVGIPGTGVSYRERLDRPARAESTGPSGFGAGANDDGEVRSVGLEELIRLRNDPRVEIRDPRTKRKLSLREIDAKIREMETSAKVEQANQEVSERERAYQDLLNFWRPLPEIESREQSEATLTPHPFQPQRSSPVAPDLAAERMQYFAALVAERRRSWPYSMLPALFARSKVRTEFQTLWPIRELEIEQRFGEATALFEQQMAEESEAWKSQEQTRISWLKKLLDGDLEECNRTATRTISELRFPFETDCDILLESSAEVFVHLDLPEIENVIPSTEETVRSNGERKVIRRDPLQCRTEYATLVMGLAVFLAATLFAFLPLLGVVHVAAYTQRPKRRKTDPIDSYVLDLALHREEVVRFRDREEELAPFLARQGGRFYIRDNGELASIDPPVWVETAGLASGFDNQDKAL